MKPKLIIFALMIVLLCPVAFGYSFNFSYPSPPDGSERYTTQQNTWTEVASLDTVMIPSCFLFICSPNYVDAETRINVYKNGTLYLDSAISGPGYLRFYKNVLQRPQFNFAVEGGNRYSWRYCLQELGSSTVYCSPFYNFTTRYYALVNPPPAINNLKTCTASSGGSCYDPLPPAQFNYNTGIIYPHFNITVYTSRVDICIEAQTSSRGRLSSCVTKYPVANQSFIFGEIGIPVSPGDNVSWYATEDDWVNIPITQTSVINSKVLTSSNVPPVITLNYPAGGQSFQKGTSNVVLNATVTDSDTPQYALAVQFKIKSPGQTSYTVPCISPTVIGSTYLCPVNVLSVGRYDWKVEAVDESSQNLQTKGSYFYIETAASSNYLPEMDTLSPSTANVALGKTYSFFMNATDRDIGDTLYFDIYCNYIPNGVSEDDYGDSPNASSGWVSSGVSPSSQTRTCPDSSKDPGQWQTPGRYWVRACVTDGDATDGKMGFQTYTKCKDSYVNVMNASEYVIANLNESIEFKNCLVGDGCVLNEFYYGMIGFFREFLVYFIMIFITFLIALAAYYIYLRVKEGFI